MSKKPEEPKKLIGITAYANYRKCTLSNVQEKLRKGKIPFVMYNGKRMIDPESADLAWLANVSSHKPNEQYKIDDAGTGPKAEISIGQQKTNVPNIHIEEAYFKACQVTSFPESSNLFSMITKLPFLSNANKSNRSKVSENPLNSF